MSLQVNDVVEFVHPYDDEVGTTYRLVELNGDRCIIEAVCNLPIRPTCVRLTADLQKIGDAQNEKAEIGSCSDQGLNETAGIEARHKQTGERN